MALSTSHKETNFGVGDKVRVTQKIKEGEKQRSSLFEGMVIALKNSGQNMSFTVRRIGEAGVGIEKIFQLSSPFLESIQVLKKGTSGVHRSKLYYTRRTPIHEVEEIYARTQRNAPKDKKRIRKSR